MNRDDQSESSNCDVFTLLDRLEKTVEKYIASDDIDDARELCRTSRALFAAMEEEVLWSKEVDSNWYEDCVAAFDTALNVLRDRENIVPEYLVRNVSKRVKMTSEMTYESVVNRLQEIASSTS